jgi:hypothetical protein
VGEGSAITVFPIAIAGSTAETKPRRGDASGHAMPSTPIGSGMASVTLRKGVWCTWPSYLSAQAAYT